MGGREKIPCASCGYDLVGLAEDGVCPECGLRIAASIARYLERGLHAAALRPVVRSRGCIGCGYELRGLPVEGMCPECGSAVRESFGPRLLRYGSATYLTDIARGASVLWWATWLATLGLCLPPLAVASPIVMLVGWWLLTPSPPDGLPGRRGETSRRLTRACVVLATVGIVCGAMRVGAGARVGDAVLSACVLGSAISAFLACVVGLAYVRCIADRVPDRGLWVNSGFAQLASPVAVVFAAFVWVHDVVAGNMTWGAYTAMGMVLLFFGTLAWVLLFVRVVHQLRTVLREERDYVREVRVEGSDGAGGV